MKKLYPLFLVLLLALAGCGGNSSNSSSDSSNAASADAALANITASEVPLYKSFYATTLAATYGFPIIPVPPPAPLATGAAPLAVYSWNCTDVQPSGDLSDPDDDGIPADGHYQGECTVTETTTGTYSWQLDFSMKDADNADPKAGFSSDGSITWAFKSVDGSESWQVTWTATEHSAKLNSSGSYDLVYKGSWQYTDNADPSNNTQIEYDFSGTWTPDNPNADFADIWESGSFDVSGSVTITGSSCTAEVDTASFDIHFDSNGCADRATIHYTGSDCDGETCDATASWSSCNGTVTVTGGCQ